jgi:DNA-binding transcriptional MerR regulator
MKLIEYNKSSIEKLVDIIKIDENKLVVTQANALARSVQEMTLQEKRLLLLIISQVRKSDENFKEYRIPIRVIQEYLKLDNKIIYKIIDEVTTKLMSRVLYVENGNGGWEKFQWVSRCRYHSAKKSKTGESYIEMQLHSDLHPLLLNLREHFGSIPLLQIAPMPSVNSIRVFEILWFTSMRLIKTELSFRLDDFKKRLGLENKYLKFRDFRKDVLDRAQRDCATYSPLSFTWFPEKQGRKFAHLYFHLEKNIDFTPPPFLPFMKQGDQDDPVMAPASKPKPKPTTVTSPKNDVSPVITPENQSFDKMLEDHGVSEEKIHELLTKYPIEQIKQNLEIVRQKHENDKVPDGALSRYTIKAITEDWHGSNQSPLEKEKDAEKMRQQQAEERHLQRRALEDRFNTARAEAIKALHERIKTETPELYEAEKAKFLESIKNDRFLYPRHQKEGFESPAVLGNFRIFLSENYLDPEYRDLEAWCTKNQVKII